MPTSARALMLGVLLCAVSGAPTWCGDSDPLPVVVAPGNELIRYIGRFDKRNPEKFRFAWAGSSFVFRFTGKSVNLVMKDECGGGANANGGNMNNYFTVVIDDKAPLELSLEQGRTVYRIGEGLEDGTHTVTVVRRNCPRIGAANFLGLQLEAGKALADLPPKKQRFIEVIGDSISVGYGILGKEKSSPATPVTENCYLSYGAIAARALDADFASISWSGFGVYRDVGGTTNYLMGNLYDLTVPLDPAPADPLLWNFKEYTPDAVVIALSTNDFEKGIPEQEPFNAAYRALIEKAWKNAPNARIFCTSSAMLGDRKQIKAFKTYMTDLIDQFAKEGKTNVHFVQFPSMHDVPNGLGGMWHPGVATHQAMADILVASIKKEMSW